MSNRQPRQKRTRQELGTTLRVQETEKIADKPQNVSFQNQPLDQQFDKKKHEQEEMMLKIQQLIGQVKNQTPGDSPDQSFPMGANTPKLEENSRLIDMEDGYRNQQFMVVNNTQMNAKRFNTDPLWDPDKYPDDGSDYWRPTSGESRTRRHRFETLCSALKKLLIVPFKGIEYIADGGQKSNKIFIKKMMVKDKGQVLSKEERLKLRETDMMQYYWQMTSFVFQYILMPIIVLFSSALCLMNLIMWSYYRVDDIDVRTFLVVTDYMVFVLFTIEVGFNIWFSVDLDEVFDFENALLLIINYEIIWTNTEQEHMMVFNFLHSLRSLRVTKLRYVTKLFSYYIYRYLQQLRSDDLSVPQGGDIDEDEEMNKFLVEQLINLLGGLFVEASFLLALDRSMDYEAFIPYNLPGGDRFDYLKASYFVILTFTTVGYGDIVPASRWSRLFMVVALIVNVTVMSNFLGGLISQIHGLTSTGSTADFKDHVVLVGHLEEEQIIEFLEELVENDNVDRTNHNAFGQLQQGIKCVIVLEKEPSSSLRLSVDFISDRYENEIVLLKENILSTENRWYRKTNLYEARVLFVFSQDNSNIQLAYAYDQRISMTARGAKEEVPNLRVHLVLNSDFKMQIENDSLFKDIEVISRRQLNEFIMASSVENPGLSATLQHVFTMKQKNVSDTIQQLANQDDFLYSYIRDMQSEIYQIKIPDFFVGMTYRKLAQILYIHNLDMDLDHGAERFIHSDAIKVNKSITLIAIETIADDNFVSMHDDSSSVSSVQNDQRRAEQLQDSTHNHRARSEQTKTPPNRNTIFPINDTPNQKAPTTYLSSQWALNSPSSQDRRKNYRTEILTNPQNYNIKKNDVAYVFCNDHQLAKSVESITSIRNPEYQRFLLNFEIIKHSILTQPERQAMIEEMFSQIAPKLTPSYLKAPETNQQRVQLAQANYVDLEEALVLPEKVPYTNHIIVFGKLMNPSFSNIIHVLRRYSDRKVLLFSQEEVNFETWSDICYMFRNVVYYRGTYINLTHLDLLQIRDCHQVLITTELANEEGFPDSTGLCLATILYDYYEFTSFLLELRDEGKIDYLNHLPKLKNQQCPSFLKACYMQGNIHFSSMPTCIFARIVFNLGWFRLIQDLVVPKAKAVKQQNQTINTLCITKVQVIVYAKNVQDSFRYFGMLQFALMEYKPSILAIALIKQKIGSQYQEVKLENLLGKGYIQQLAKEFQLMDQQEAELIGKTYNKEITLNKFKEYLQHALGRSIGLRYVLTNPHAFTLIEEGDHVIVIGGTKEISPPTPKQAANQQISLPSLGVKERPIDVPLQTQVFEDIPLRQDLKAHLIRELESKIASIRDLEDRFNSIICKK